MALSIMNNPTAIGAIGRLNKANTALSKTISQLSSGLRINSAADDASGLAVSEKLRGQISGLAKAASNAQDAISFLQTAEASMGSMTDLLQRMRELSVQAGDPAYTTNDRSMLQNEVDQLKNEINRISTSTEFNTKKLLNGDSAGVWSSSSANIEAIMKGAPAEGNYKIDSFASGGKNEVQKTQVMKTREGVQSVEPNSYNNASGIGSINNVKGLMAKDGNNVGLQIDTAKSEKANVTIVGEQGMKMSGAATAINVSAGVSGYVEFNAKGSITAGGSIQARFVDANTGLNGNWTNIKVDNKGKIEEKVDLGKGVNLKEGESLDITGKNAVTKGGTALFAVNGSIQTGSTTAGNVLVATNANGTQGYNIRVNNLISDGGDMKHTFYTGQIDEKTGQVYYGSMDITLQKASNVTVTGKLTPKDGLHLNASNQQGPASKWTKLSELSNFVNADGRNVLDNTQGLTIYGGNGKQAKIFLEGSDTINDLENKLTSAIVDQLGMGSKEASVNDNLVNFVEKPTPNSNEAVKGTFVIQSASVGANSKMSFVGDQNVLNALGLNVLQKAEDSETTAKIYNAHTGELIGGGHVSDNILRGVIKGVDVKLNPAGDNAITASYENGKMMFRPSEGGASAFLHIKSNPTTAVIGANEGQTLDISIGRMDTTALGIDNVVVATFDDAQKSITKLDKALETLSVARSTAGAQMNRLDYTINSLDTMRENLTAADSRLRDLDVAQSSSNLSAQQVRLQAATAMLAQASQIPSFAAQLLK